MSNPKASAPVDRLLPPEIAATVADPKAYADRERLHGAFTWARANNPLGVAELDGFDPFWVVTKHADIISIGRNNTLFRNSDRSSVLFPKAAIAQFVAMTGKPNVSDTLIALDDPEHQKLRQLTQSWFMPGSVVKLDDRFRGLAKSVIDGMAAHGGKCDFVTDVAMHYPLRVIMDILGVPPADEPRMLKLTQEIFSPRDPELSRAQDGAVDALAEAKLLGEVFGEFSQYFAEITADRRANPRDDIATVLANATLDGSPLNDRILSNYYIIIATAGHDTTSSSSAAAMWALARFPKLLPSLKADPSLIPGFIDETIRWETPVRHFMRTAATDTEIRGRKIAKGDWLMLCFASGNRDEEVFESPFEFRISRRPNRHIAFGYGPHMCLGQHLAKAEIRVLLEELIPRLESVEFAGEPELSASNFVGGLKHLPIRYRLS